MRRPCLALVLLTTCFVAANAQSALPLCPSVVDYSGVKACSLTGVNGDCTIIIDRMRPATPPTIYVRRGRTVTLQVVNPSPLEKLELDEASINTQIPIDPVQALASLLTQLGQFALPLQPPPANAGVRTPEFETQPASTQPPASPSFDDIQEEQIKFSDQIAKDTTVDPTEVAKLKMALATLRTLLVPPLDACNSNSSWAVAWDDFSNVAVELSSVQNTIKNLVGAPGTGAGGAGERMAQDATTLVSIQADIDQFSSGVTAAQKKSDKDIAGLETSNASLQKQIDEEEKKRQPDIRLIQSLKDKIASQQHSREVKEKDAHGLQLHLGQLKAAQGVLTDKLSSAQTLVKTVLFPAETKLHHLVKAMSAIKNPPAYSGPFKITDLLSEDKNDQQEVFTLNAVNSLTDPVKIFIASAATDPYSQALADSIVSTAPTKTAVMQATVQFVTQPEMEVTAGVLVPVLPYKSYTAAPQSAGSAILLAQETHTFTIIPAVDLNFRLGNDKFVGNKRFGWFGTVAVGYNPATSMVEFGVGPSVALKSMVFSFLADIGRDTELASGFSLNQPLPGVATTPATNGVWSVKPSIGFSIRLPFNSGGGH
jgi:hypothetical protein